MSRARIGFGLVLLAACGAAFATGFRALGGAEVAFSAFGERFALLAPEWLAALCLLPLLPFGLAGSLADLPPVSRIGSLLLRGLLLGCLALALARPARSHDATRVGAVLLVDVSDSVTDAALDRARRLVREAHAARGQHELAVVAFAGHAAPVALDRDAPDAALQRLAERGEVSEAPGAQTDLQAALQLAYGLFQPGTLKRAAFLSDGLQTRGDLLSEAARAERLGVRVFFARHAEEQPAEVAVTALELPDQLAVGETFELAARVFASVPGRARLRLYQDRLLNGLDGVRDVELARGDNEIRFKSIVRRAGEVTYRIEIDPGGPDRFSENNEVRTTAVVPGRPSLLVVDSEPQQARELARALSIADFEVEVRSASAMPRSLGELARYDMLWLSDVPAEQIGPMQMEALERYVRDLGGGFMMLGGQHGFGLGGYRGTRIADLLPVHMDSKRSRDEHSLALALVIDCSGSMSGQKIELAKDAAKAAAELLGPDDSISVVGFSGEPERIVRMQSARNRVRIDQSIGRLTAQGGTAIFPALDTAFQDLLSTSARVKHVILLTDGQTQESGILELVETMRVESVTVSTVGLGADVHRGLLQQTASAGGGRAYFTDDPHHVPRIFIRETTTVGRNSAVEELVRVLPREPADFLKGIGLGAAPLLRGYIATREKPRPAQVVLESELGEPILARWRVGLGWVLAWTPDLKPRWAADWLRWRELPRFLGQLVREHMRKQRQDELPMQARLDGDALHVVVDAIGADDRFLNGLDSTLTVQAPGRGEGQRERTTHRMRQSAPGRYEARVPLPVYGPYTLQAVHRQADRVVARSAAAFNHPYSAEYAGREPDHDLLARMAELTGGAELRSMSDLYERRGERVIAREEIWSELLLLALGIFLLDISLRRVRLGARAGAARS